MTRYLIAGNGIAGVRAAEAIRRRDLTSPITIVCDETGPAYSRVLLPHLLNGEMGEERLVIRPLSWYEQYGVSLVQDDGAASLHPDEHSLRLVSGRQLAYSRLLIATGASAAFPPVKGLRTGNVFGFRSIQDVRGIISSQAKQAVVIGAGPIGLLAAEALLQQRMQVTVVEMLPQVLPQMMDLAGASIVEEAARGIGMEVVTGARVMEVAGRNGTVAAVYLADGRELPCQLLVVATGVIPNTAWLKESGVNMARGLVVDEEMRTNLPDVWAAGDVCETTDCISLRCMVNALWPGASEQGRVAGMNMVGIPSRYEGSLAMNSATFCGVPCIGIGVTSGEIELVDDRRAEGVYRRAFLTRDGMVAGQARLVGMVLVGDIRGAGMYLSLMRRRVPLPENGQGLWGMEYATSLSVGLKEGTLALGQPVRV